MDVTQIQQVVTIDDFVREHMRWLFTMLPIIWAAAAGAFVRLLLIRAEPFWMRSQNAMAGLLLAVTLADITANLLTNGSYATGYAVIYGMVGRELFVTMHDFVHDKAAPLLMSAMRHYLPFLFTEDDEDNHDNT